MNTIPYPIVLLSFMLCDHSHAEGPERPKAPPGDERPAQHFHRMWQEADQDASGSLSMEEFTSLPRVQMLDEERRTRLFERLDKNSDGSIQHQEMMAGKPPGQDGERKKPRLWELDKDRNEKIDRAEFEQSEFSRKLPEERREKLFERLDTNGDGVISREDIPEERDGKRPGSFLKPDRKANRPDGGKLDMPEERGKLRDFPKAFDTTQDQAIDFDEFSKIPFVQKWDEDRQEDYFEEMDKNQDLKITPDEWKPAMK